MAMPDTAQPRSPPIFTIRLWQETLDADHVEWRGEVKNILSGEVRYFRDWKTLAILLPRMLSEGDEYHLDSESEDL
jgi:hypothetical protein